MGFDTVLLFQLAPESHTTEKAETRRRNGCVAEEQLTKLVMILLFMIFGSVLFAIMVMASSLVGRFAWITSFGIAGFGELSTVRLFTMSLTTTNTSLLLRKISFQSLVIWSVDWWGD
jgi:hypothetical protein